MHSDQNEQARLAALRSYEVLDTESEAAFDEIASMAAEWCEVPIAVVSLIDEYRQWSKAAHGCPRGEVERSKSFCTHAIESDEALVVRDATRDPRRWGLVSSRVFIVAATSPGVVRSCALARR